MFVLPPHTTQICQPLDKGVFASLKTSWREVCNSFMVSSPGRVITRYDFSGLFCQAWDNCMTIKILKLASESLEYILSINLQSLFLRMTFSNSNHTYCRAHLELAIFLSIQVVHFKQSHLKKNILSNQNQKMMRIALFHIHSPLLSKKCQLLRQQSLCHTFLVLRRGTPKV